MSFYKNTFNFVKYLLFFTALTPLIYSSDFIFPFITGKMFFFRIAVEIALILFLIYLICSKIEWRRLISFFKNPLVFAISLFFVSSIASVVFAFDPYRAFWGDLERAEGLFGLLHFLAFLIMAAAVFEKKDWLDYFKISLGIGLIVLFYGFFQYFNVVDFPFFPKESAGVRPGSFIGNPAFLASYLIVLMLFAFVIFFSSQKFWRYFSALFIFLSIIAVFITGTRGAILGITSGILFLLVYLSFQKQFIHIRRLSLFLLVLSIIFSGVFWVSRGNEIWQNIPGLNRLAQTKFVDKNDGSTQMRLMVWQASGQAIKEKPVFGWGLENFLMAYSKHYDPDMALVGETWMDRAHNKILDVLVMQGIFGLLAYLSIFGSILYLFFRKRLDFGNQLTVPVLTSGIIAYFVQNLFVFDDLNVYLPFFAFLGFLTAESIKNFPQHILKQDFSFSFAKFLFALLSLAIIYSILHLNYIPYMQAKYARQAVLQNNKDAIINLLKQSFSPYNFSQPSLRAYVIDDFYSSKAEVFEKPELADLSLVLENALNEIFSNQLVSDPRFYIRQNQIFNIKARNDSNWYVLSETAARKGLELSPNRLELHYGLAFSLAGQNRLKEAIETAEKAVELSPSVARSHYYLSLVNAVAGNIEKSMVELGEVKRLDKTFSSLMPADRDGMIITYLQLNQTDKLTDLIIRQLDKEISGFNFKKEHYIAALNYFLHKHDSQSALKLAKYLVQFPELKDDMDVIIDLLDKNAWGIIEKLLSA